MTVFKICGITAIFLVFALCFFRGRENIGVFVALGLSLLIVLSGGENIIPIFDYVEEVSLLTSDFSEYLKVMLKSLGVALVCSATAGICRENGERTVGACVEFFGKGEMLVLALPVIKDLIQMVTSST